MNELYGFEGECTHKYDLETYKFFTQLFNWLPLCVCIHSHTDKKVTVMHGGLFDQADVTLDDIRKIDRNRQPPESGLRVGLVGDFTSKFFSDSKASKIFKTTIPFH